MQKKSSTLYYIDFAGDTLRLGGSALAQTMGLVGNKAPEVDAVTLAHAFGAVQTIVRKRKALAMHDVSAGGLVTTLLEMAFANTSKSICLKWQAVWEATWSAHCLPRIRQW